MPKCDKCESESIAIGPLGDSLDRFANPIKVKSAHCRDCNYKWEIIVK